LADLDEEVTLKAFIAFVTPLICRQVIPDTAVYYYYPGKSKAQNPPPRPSGKENKNARLLEAGFFIAFSTPFICRQETGIDAANAFLLIDGNGSGT
jgi:hypothetical protein